MAMETDQYLEDSKIWKFYLKDKPDEVYAYTIVKEIKDAFMSQRNMDKLRIEKDVVDEFEFGMFTNKHRGAMLSMVPIGIGIFGQVMNVALTYDEEDELNELGHKLDDEMEQIFRTLVEYPIKDKYRESIDYLLTTAVNKRMSNGDSMLVSTFNMVAGMTELFPTF